jgi:GAF domain-containing protein
VPRSIAAVPLLDEHHGGVGVLQVLDKRGEPTFSLRDMELLGVFAAQATVGIAAARVQRDTARLLATVLGRIGPDLDEPQVATLVSAATRNLETDAEAPFWALVDQVARLRSMSDAELALVADILEVIAQHADRRSRRGRRG